MSRRRENGEIDPCIDIVIGNNHKKDLVRILREYEENREKDRAGEIGDINMTKEYESLHLPVQVNTPGLISKYRMAATSSAPTVYSHSHAKGGYAAERMQDVEQR